MIVVLGLKKKVLRQPKIVFAKGSKYCIAYKEKIVYVILLYINNEPKSSVKVPHKKKDGYGKKYDKIIAAAPEVKPVFCLRL